MMPHLTAILALAAAPVADLPRVGILDRPCAALPASPTSVAAYLKVRAAALAARRVPLSPTAEALKLYADWQRRLRDNDFPGLCRYEAANAALPPASDRRVVFFGDSITELWGLNAPTLFRDDILNRGISGQTTTQMIGRFRADVIELHPKVVHILAGTNDIAGNTGPVSLRWIENNIETMVDLAQSKGIQVVLAAVPPAARFAWRPDVKPLASIKAYNRWLADYAARRRLVFIDYHGLLDDGQGGFLPRLSADGVHPNAAGYDRMTIAARKILDVSGSDGLRSPQ